MHREVLTTSQGNLLPLVKQFHKDFGLVGGTAIALHIGHRTSIDFDLFTNLEFENEYLRNNIVKTHLIEQVIRDQQGEYTLVINGVRFTFLYYPFVIDFSDTLDETIRLPNLLTLGAMKAYAMGRRPKWKDYVDIFFIMKRYHSLEEIVEKAEVMFGKEFNEKLFRMQLSYFDDIDYSEEVIFQEGFQTDRTIIQENLTEWSLAHTVS